MQFLFVENYYKYLFTQCLIMYFKIHIPLDTTSLTNVWIRKSDHQLMRKSMQLINANNRKHMHTRFTTTDYSLVEIKTLYKV